MLHVKLSIAFTFARNKDILMCFQSPQIIIDQGSNMSANVLLNELGKLKNARLANKMFCLKQFYTVIKLMIYC